MQTSRASAESDTQRIEAFSDAVFAIAITLLILEIRVPELNSMEGTTNTLSLASALFVLWPSYFAYIFSFVVIGIFWANHHYVFQLYERSDQVFRLFNLLFLMCISFLPFPTAVLARCITDPQQLQTATVLYALVLFLSVLTWLLIWLYASRNHRLLNRNLDGRFIAYLTRTYIARYPELALVSVSTQITIIDLAPRDFDLIEPIRDEAKRAVNEEDFPTGRALLHNLVSEIRTSTVNLPLETYPDAMKESARLLHQGRTDEARAVMQLALSTLVVTEQSRPIPLINALTELAAAMALAAQGQDQQNQDQQNRDQVLRLLEDARTQLKLARELGYARRDPEYKELDRAIRDIERQIRAKEKTESPFAKLREKFSSFFNRVSRVNRPSHESQQTANA